MEMFKIAANVESHPAVREVLLLNMWKIKTWADYAGWKKHGRKWVSLDTQWKKRGWKSRGY